MIRADAQACLEFIGLLATGLVALGIAGLFVAVLRSLWFDDGPDDLEFDDESFSS